MRVRRRQFHTFGRRLLLVVVEPFFAWLKAGYDRMAGRRSMLRSMLTRRTVTAPDVPTLRTSAEMKPPTFGRRKTFDTPVATWFGGEIDSAMIFFHFCFSCIPSDVASSETSAKYQQDFPSF
jgi:hypothetical protein